jgi:hypothetical protein
MSPNNDFMKTYGGQDDTQPSSGGFHKRLNLFPDASPRRSRDHEVDILPLHVEYMDTVGMPSPENWFVTYHLRRAYFDQSMMPYANNSVSQVNPSGTCYDNGKVDSSVATGTGCYQKSGYEPQGVIHIIPDVVYVEVEDLGTGNAHNDKGFEASLMHQDFEQCADNRGLFRHDEHFHVGFHARDTRPTNFRVRIKIWPVVDQSYFPTNWKVHTESINYAYPPDDYMITREPGANEIYEYIQDLIKRGVMPPMVSPTYSVEINDTPHYGWNEEDRI